MKISERAEILLGVVRERTVWNNGKLERYWLSFNGCEPSSVYGESFKSVIAGGGDMRCLQSLERKGLIKRVDTHSLAFAATEDGCVLYEKIAERRGMYSSTGAFALTTRQRLAREK